MKYENKNKKVKKKKKKSLCKTNIPVMVIFFILKVDFLFT